MRYLGAAIILATMTWSLPALAQALEEEASDGESQRGPLVRERLLNAFDKDNSGTLDEGEREAMRQHFRESRPGRRSGERDGRRRSEGRASEDRQSEDRQSDDRRGEERSDDPENRDREGEARRRDGERGPRDRNAARDRDARRPRRERDGDRGRARERRPDAERRGGPRRGPADGQGPNLMALFVWFDSDRDGQLSREEFAGLAEFVRHRSERRPGPPGALDRDGEGHGEARRGGGPGAPRRDGERRRGERGDRPGRDRGTPGEAPAPDERDDPSPTAEGVPEPSPEPTLDEGSTA